MEGQLIQKTFAIDETSIDYWVIKTDNKFWLKAHDITVFLGYQNPEQAVRSIPTEARKTWEEFDPAMIQQGPIPPYWKPNTVLISEGGLYRLLCKRT